MVRLAHSHDFRNRPRAGLVSSNFASGGNNRDQAPFEPVATMSSPAQSTFEAESAAALLIRCASGDQDAFRSLYDLESARLYGLALRLTRQPQLAADAVHDAFMQVWQRAARFDPSRGAAEAWLSTLLRYRAIDIMRSRVREQYGDDLPETVDTAPDPLAMLAATDEGAALRHCLDALEPAPRQVVTLSFLHGLSHADLAKRLEAPLGTVKSWVRRALQSLRQCLES
jgi:RNA polymerase sigma-70 factor (ECF subfamily)